MQTGSSNMNKSQNGVTIMNNQDTYWIKKKMSLRNTNKKVEKVDIIKEMFKSKSHGREKYFQNDPVE